MDKQKDFADFVSTQIHAYDCIPGNRDATIYVENDFFMDSPAVQNALKNLQEGERKRIAFKAETAYNTASPDHRVALGVTPDFCIKRMARYISSPMRNTLITVLHQ